MEATKGFLNSDVLNTSVMPRKIRAPRKSAANSNAASKKISKMSSRNANSSSSIGSVHQYVPSLRKVTALVGLNPGKFYKRESQEKKLLPRLEFFYFRSPLN